MVKKLTYESAGKRQRIDKYLKECLAVPREKIKEFLRSGHILVNGKKAIPSYLLKNGDEIITVEPECFFNDSGLIKPEQGRIAVIYEDSEVIVVNKPSGILVHPTSRIFTGTLVNFLLYRTELASIGMPFRPGVVHRLDKETSGAIIFAKTNFAWDSLVCQFQNRKVDKEYIAVVKGRFHPSKMEVEFSVLPDKDNRTRMEVHYLRGKKAITVLEVIKYIDDLTVIKAKPITGRTHQIRITLTHLGYPIIGDLKYGIGSDLIDRVALHSHKIAFSLPSSGKKVAFTAEIPPDLQKIINKC